MDESCFFEFAKSKCLKSNFENGSNLKLFYIISPKLSITTVACNSLKTHVYTTNKLYLHICTQKEYFSIGVCAYSRSHV